MALELALKQIVGAGGWNEGCLRDKLQVGVGGIRVGFETNCGCRWVELRLILKQIGLGNELKTLAM